MAAPIDLPTRCKCGHLAGTALHVSPKTVNRFLCYCHDCRAYLRWLGRADLLDAGGGVDIVQMALTRARFSHGEDALRCVRLSAKGMHRWYADCCRTPVGNTIIGIPFIGMLPPFLDPDLSRPRDETCGDAVAINEASATGPIPGGVQRLRQARALAHAARTFATWTISGLGAPTALFDAAKAPRAVPAVLTPRERDALRDRG